MPKYLEMGNMSAVSDATKVPSKFVPRAKEAMKKTVTKVIELESKKKDPKLTTTAPSNGKGFKVNLTLTEITFLKVSGEDGVSCRFSGAVADLQGHFLTQSLTGGGKTTGTGEIDVVACVEESMKKMMLESVIPFVNDQP